MKETAVGKIPNEWQVKSLTDISKIIDCLHSKKPMKTKTGIAYLEVFNLIKDSASINLSNIEYVSEEDYAYWIRRTVPEEGDLVITNTGIIATAIIPENFKCCIGRNMTLIKPDKKQILPQYLRFYTLSDIYKREIQRLSLAGTILESLHVKYISQINVPIPTLNEQERIVNILVKIQQKKELNQQMNKTLEAIGQAIFKHWFIDFEFPDENGKPYRSSGGKMVDSELWQIPEGWEVRSLDECADFLNGLALQKYPAKDGEDYLPVIKIRELRQGITESVDKANMNVPKEYVINDGDILFSWSGSLEVVIWGFGRGALNQHLFKVTSAICPKWFIYYWIIHFLPEYRAIASDKATTMGHIQRHHLSASKVVVPDDATLKRMNVILNPIVERISQLKVETRLLSELRDYLLPKLMSGKIRVPVSETRVG